MTLAYAFNMIMNTRERKRERKKEDLVQGTFSLAVDTAPVGSRNETEPGFWLNFGSWRLVSP